MQVNSIKNNYNHDQKYNYSPNFRGKIVYTPEISRAFDYADDYIKRLNYNDFSREGLIYVLKFCNGLQRLLTEAPNSKVIFEHDLQTTKLYPRQKRYNLLYPKDHVRQSANVRIKLPYGAEIHSSVVRSEALDDPISLMQSAYFHGIGRCADPNTTMKEYYSVVDDECFSKLKTKKQEELAILRNKIIKQNRIDEINEMDKLIDQKKAKLLNLEQSKMNEINEMDKSIDQKNAELKTVEIQLKNINESVRVAENQLTNINEQLHSKRLKLIEIKESIYEKEKMLLKLNKEIKENTPANNKIHYGFSDRIRVLFGLHPKK